MAKARTIKPFETWKMPLGGVKVHLSHEEVLTVSDSTAPIAALISMVPQIAPVAPIIVLYWWLVKKAEKKYGSRGIDFYVGPVATSGLIPLPPEE